MPTRGPVKPDFGLSGIMQRSIAREECIMTRHNVLFATAILVLIAASIAPAGAQITPPSPIQVSTPIVTIMSSPSIVVHAVSVTKTSSNNPVELDDTGNANPDFDFRYDASLMGYVFNLSTKGYATGTYKLNFIAGADPNIHSAGFAVK